MNARQVFLLFAAVLAGMRGLGAQDAPSSTKPTAAEDLIKLAQPGPEHERLASYAGTWDLTITMGSGARGVVYQGTAENRLLAGGRFLQTEYETRAEAGTLDGTFCLGFDRRHQHYTLIAIDTFGTYFVTSQGKLDATSGKLRLRGTDDDPMMKAMGYTKEFVHAIDLRKPNEFVIEVWFVDTRTKERREFKYMDYTFKRKA